MAPMDFPSNVKDNVSSLLCLYNDISKNLMLPNAVAFNMIKNNDDYDVILANTLLMASTTNETWIQHLQGRF